MEIPVKLRFGRLLLTVVLFSSAALRWQKNDVPPAPPTPKQPVVDEYHGVKVTEDYRWLEDDKNPRVIAWTSAQDAHARGILDPLPLHAAIYQFMRKLGGSRSPSYYNLNARGGVLFAMNSQPSKQQDMLVTLRSADDPGSKHVVLDPSQVDPTNSTAIQFFEPSLDGSKVAVSLAAGGELVGPISVYDVASGHALPDVLTHVGGLTGASVAWNTDSAGFYYTHYPHEGERPPEDLNFYEQVYFHKLGTPQSQDTYVMGKDFPRIVEIRLSESKDGRYVLAAVGNGDGNRYEHFLREPSGEWKQLSQFSDEVKMMAFGDDGALYMLSHQNAPRGKILRVPLATPEVKNAKTIVPQSAAVLQDFLFTLAGLQPALVATANFLYVIELAGGPTEIHIFDHEGRELGKVPSEPVSAITQIVSMGDDKILFGNQSYLDPQAWFHFDPATKKASVTSLRETYPVSFANVEVVREFCLSKDGTKIPLNILRRKGIKLNGQNPALLTGYGGFGLSLTPSFDPEIRPWLDAGGVYAIANLRGGGEFGEEWHTNGSVMHKQNVFDDFVASAEYLIKTGYTNSSKLGIVGGSNGGLLVSAVTIQRPELFRAVVSIAGVHDMLRLESTENGQFLTAEFGSVKDPEQFKNLYAYSPYHHVRDGVKYPAILFLTGENDPAVAPWNSRKMTARLQAANASDHPVLLINFSNAGHGGIGASEDQQTAMDTYTYEFMYDQLGVKWAGGSQASQ
jgi:prolyl oligopeptidase